jgi:hypothetical protein
LELYKKRKVASILSPSLNPSRQGREIRRIREEDKVIKMKTTFIISAPPKNPFPLPGREGIKGRGSKYRNLRIDTYYGH